MIKFYEYRQEDEIDFVDGVNNFLKEKLKLTDALLSVKYQKFIEKGETKSKVLLVVDENVKSQSEASKKELVFFELNEHSMNIPKGKTFDEVINDEFGELLNPEDDLYAIEYCNYFYKGSPYSSILILINVSF